VNFFLELTINGLLTGGLYALVALGIVLVFKATEVVSIAHGQFLVFGAVFFWVFYVGAGFPLWLSLLLALASGALLGFLTERLWLRPLIGQPLFSSFLMTFGIFMFLDGILQLILKGKTWGLPSFLATGTITVGDIKLFVGDLMSFAICLAVFLITMIIFRYTKFGLGMRATAESHQLAQSVGINVRVIFSLVWIISAMIAVVAGITAARVMDIHFPLPWLIVKGLVVAMVGGLDSLPGALAAGLVLGVLENEAAGYLDPIVGGGIKEVAAYVVLLFILLVRPQGLFGLIRIKRV